MKLQLAFEPLTFFFHRFHFHNAYTDPLGWTKQSLFTVKHFSATGITQLLQETQHAKTSILVIDSLSFVVRHHDPVVICQELQKLRKGLSLQKYFNPNPFRLDYE